MEHKVNMDLTQTLKVLDNFRKGETLRSIFTVEVSKI